MTDYINENKNRERSRWTTIFLAVGTVWVMVLLSEIGKTEEGRFREKQNSFGHEKAEMPISHPGGDNDALTNNSN